MSNAHPEVQSPRLRLRLLGELRALRIEWQIALGLCLLTLQLFSFHGVRHDDAYITYRYGQNLARGLGLVFNPGQYVQGSTSPGQMLTSALVYAVFGSERTPGVMAALGCLAWTAQAFAVVRLLAAALGPLGAATVALAVALGISGAAHWVALETHLVAALSLWGLTFARERRWLAAVGCSSLAVLFRPDAALALSLVLVACIWQLRRQALRPLMLGAAIALPWPIFATFVYGSPIPQSARTKFHNVELLDYFGHELQQASERLLWPGVETTWGIVLLALGLSTLGALRLLRRDRALWPLVAWGVLHAAAYLVLRPFKQHLWHLYPWILVFCICGLSALVPAANGSATLAQGVRWSRILRLTQSVALVLTLFMNALRFERERNEVPSGYWNGQRDAVYREIAAWLKRHARPSDWFAAVEVGTIAYYSDLSGYDLGGLVRRDDDPIAAHPVRFVVVDRFYMKADAPVQPVFSAQSGEFIAYVYEPVK